MELLNFGAIEKLIDFGEADQHLERFVKFTIFAYIQMQTGQIPKDESVQDAIVAAVVLQRLANTTDGRRLLKKRASNKVYNAKDEPPNSAKLDIARRLIQGEITEPTARTELRQLLNAADIHPDPKTLNSLLRELTSEAFSMQTDIHTMMRMAGWDGVSQDDLRATFESITQGIPKHT